MLDYIAHPSFVDCATSAYLWYDWAITYLSTLMPATILLLVFTRRQLRWQAARRLSLAYTCYWSLGFFNRWFKYQFSCSGWVPEFYMPLWFAAGILVIWALCLIWPWRLPWVQKESMPQDDRSRGFPVLPPRREDR